MLEALKKAFGGEPNKKLEQDAPNIEGNTELKLDMTDMNLGEQLNVALEEIIAKDGIIAEMNSKFNNMAEEIEGYKLKLNSLQAYADEVEAKAIAAAEELKAKELSDKREQLADVIGKDNPGFDVTFEALQSLNAEAFGVVLSGFKASFEAEAKSPMFQEIGVSGDCDLSGLKEEESETARLIKQNYQNQ